MFFGDEEYSTYTTSPDLSFALVNKNKADTEAEGMPELLVIGKTCQIQHRSKTNKCISRTDEDEKDIR